MTKKFPFLPLSVDAYVSDTRHLTLEQHGAYLLLLMAAWNRPHCSLPDDDKGIARTLGVTLEEWGDLKPVVMEFWSYDGRSRAWVQKRLRKERDYVQERRRKQQAKSAKRWKQTKTSDATGYAPPPPPPHPQELDIYNRIEGEIPTEVAREKKGALSVVTGGKSA